MLRISVVIPNWNGAARLECVLDSLDRQTERAYEVLVVDNASSDSSHQVTRAHSARWIPLDRNYGFARAVNTGIRQSTGDAVAIFNNDVTFPPDFLSRLANAMTGQHNFVAPKIVMASDPARLDGTFDLTNRGFCSWRAGHDCPADAAFWNQPRQIPSAPMTAALFRKSVFDHVGLLDEQFGSYLEDVDFGLRCALKGVRGCYEPSAAAIHEGSATLGGEWNQTSVRWISRNQMLLARKYNSAFSWPVLAGQFLWGLSALKRGAAKAWIQGKIEGCRMDVAPDEAISTIGHGKLKQILRSQEHEIQSLVAATGSGRMFWRAYAALTGGNA